MDINTVFLKDMHFMLPVGRDAWQREGKVQPVHITLRVDHVEAINQAAASDDVSETLDYGKLYKNIQRNLDNQKDYANILEVADQILLALKTPGTDLSLEIKLPKATLRAEGGFTYTSNRHGSPKTLDRHDSVSIRGIKCACIIGVNPHERRDKQILVIDLTFKSDAKPSSEPITAGSGVSATAIATDHYHEMIETVVKLVEGSSYQTVEALANLLCKHITTEYEIPEVEISVEKPYAIPSIGAAGVCIRRKKSFYGKADFWQTRPKE